MALNIQQFVLVKCNYLIYESVHLTLPPHTISVQVKSRSMLHHRSVGTSLKQNERNLKKPNLNPTLTLNVPLPSIVFHNKI